MLGLQNTTTGSGLPTRTYRCVACAATFSGLSSLLVHQASHANDDNPLENHQPPPTSPGISCSHCSIVLASKELMNQHRCGAFPTSSSSFICECGEQFQDHSALLDHKRLHHQSSDLQVQDGSVEENKCKTNGTACSLTDQANPSSSQGFNPVSGSDSGPTELRPILPLSGTVSASENEGKEDFSVPTSPLSPCTEVPLVPGQLTTASGSVSQPELFSALPTFTAAQGLPLLFGGQGTRPFLPSDVSTSSSILPLHQPQGLQQPKKTLKKVLFSELVKRLPPARMSWNHARGNVFSRNAVSTVAGVEASPPSHSGTSVRQLQKLLVKSSAKRRTFSQASAILNLLGSRRPQTKTQCNFVNLNRTFLPVVALETRQKLLGSGNDGMEWRHQCGRCRRIFQDVDGLILHHAIHRKERINGCRFCGYLLIGKLAVPESHSCPQTSMLSPQDIFTVGILLSSPTNTPAYSSQPGSVMADPLQRTIPVPNAKKYHCFLCNQSYTRLYSLKKHKCLGMTTILKAAVSQKNDGIQSPAIGMRMDGELKTTANKVAGDELSLTRKSVGVGTAGPRDIKLEAFDVGSVTGVLSPCSLEADSRTHVGVKRGSPKTFLPFLDNLAKCTLSDMLMSQREGSCDVPAQGFAPLLQGSLEEDKRTSKMSHGSSQSEKGKGQWTMPIDDVDIDQLIQAEGANDDDDNAEEDGDMMESIIEKSSDATENESSSQNLTFPGIGKCFTCSHCGKSYTRRFTLHQHQKKCPLGVQSAMQQNMRKASKVGKAWTGKQSFDCLQCGRSFSYRDTLVLHQKNCQLRNSRGDGNREHNGPKKRSSVPLQQDHLATHRGLFVLPPAAQEKGSKSPVNKKQATGGDWGILSLPSVLPRKVTCECGEGFTCPRLLFEHLQLHTQESYICPDCGENLSSWPVFEAHLRKHQRSVCQKCNQTFSHRKSLQRHLNRNRCKGNTTMEKKYCCPRCKLELPNAPSLRLHMQSPPCKLPHKLIRCPICMRAFGGIEGLQKHLVAHTHPNAFRCQLCQRSYPSLRSLKDHRRKVHRMVKEKCSSQEGEGGVSVLSNVC